MLVIVNRTAIVVVAAAAALAGALLAIAATRAARVPGYGLPTMETVWCKDIAPGAQYLANDIRYQTIVIGGSTGLTTPAQGCTSLNSGWQTFTPSEAP
jgi:hypothetical protein